MNHFVSLIVLLALAAFGQAALIRERRDAVQGVLGENDHNKLSGQFSDVNSQNNGRPFQSSSGSLQFENKPSGLGASVSVDKNSAGYNAQSSGLTGNFPLNDNNNLAASYSHSHINNNGYEFNKNTGSLGWENSNGHGLSGSYSQFSNGIGSQAAVNGFSNIYKSPDGNTVINANAGASQWMSGPFSNQRPGFNMGISGQHFFG